MKKLLCVILASMMLATCFAIAPSAATIQQLGYKNIAVGCSYTSTAAFTDRTWPNDYQLVDGKELTDGVYGGDAYGTTWVAYDYRMNTKPEIVVDLGAVRNDLARLNIEFRVGMNDGVSLPKSVEYFASENGTDFVSLGVGECEANGTNYKTELITEETFTARYVKAVINATATFNFASEFEICIETMVDVEIPDPDTSGFIFVGTSDLVRAGNYIRGIKPNTDYSQLGKYFVKGLSDIIVYDSKGNVKTEGILVTGDVIVKKVLGVEGENDRATIIIDGDINQNGEVDAVDYALVKRACLGTFAIEGDRLAAATITGKATVQAVDYALVKRHVLGTYNLFTKYDDKAPLSEDTMTFQKSNNSLYKLSFTYEGKAASLTFDKKTWGTWNIGTFTYDGKSIAGGGTDWEYVYRANKTGSGGFAWSGGNHGNEVLVSLDIYDSETGEKIDLATGSSVETKGIKIVEKTKMLCIYDTDGDGYGYKNASSDTYTDEDVYCETTRTYYLSGNKISLDVDYNYVADIYFQKSYTCMFPIYKTYGRNFTFHLNNGTTFSGKTTDGTVYPEYSNNYFKGHEAQKVTFYGDSQPTWKFDVEFSTPLDSTDNFSNADKVMLWDMNRVSDKLYVSKYGDLEYTLVEAGTNFGTSSSWTFYVEN